MIFIDANIFLAHNNINDIHHSRAVELIAEIENGKYGDAFTSDYVFNEVVGVTFRKTGKENAVLIGNQIKESIFIVKVDEIFLRKAWAFFEETKLGLKFIDCTNVILTELTNSKGIATFDKEFWKVENLQVFS
jgi:uncharacterized protein